MNPANILIFVLGIGTGACLTFIFTALFDARRTRRHYGVPSPYASPRNALDEPTELDQ